MVNENEELCPSCKGLMMTGEDIDGEEFLYCPDGCGLDPFWGADETPDNKWSRKE
jgi:hypothetical protein